MTDPILFERLNTSNGKIIGLITLNAEKTLNALTLEMVDLIYKRLLDWQIDDSIVCVLIVASGEKAFCAGGDVQALYNSAIETPGGPCPYAEDFFSREYRLNYLLHRYNKPVICWGHGIVMGGGLGILAACSHRVVTEKTRIAMPEVTIALFPDVGGSWFLNRMPGKSGLFLALTASSINAADSLYTGIADYFIEHEQLQSTIALLQATNWPDDKNQVDQELQMQLSNANTRSPAALPPGNVEPNIDHINQLCDSSDGKEIVATISSFKTDDKWLLKAQQGLESGSPLAALIIHHQLVISRDMELSAVFLSEIQLATNIIRFPEFSEGVRALLIDKDRNPQWKYQLADQVPPELIAQFFTAAQNGSTWPTNPLADLN